MALGPASAPVLSDVGSSARGCSLRLSLVSLSLSCPPLSFSLSLSHTHSLCLSPAQAPHLQMLHHKGSPTSRQVNHLDGPRHPHQASAPKSLQARHLPLKHLPGLRPEHGRELRSQQRLCSQTEATTRNHKCQDLRMLKTDWRARHPPRRERDAGGPLRIGRGYKDEVVRGAWGGQDADVCSKHLP